MKMSNLLASGWRGTSLTPLSDLDIALAHLLQNLQPSTDERHLWLVALASHQWGRGHACLDLNGWPANAGVLLGWGAQAHLVLSTEWADVQKQVYFCSSFDLPFFAEGGYVQ
mgnify:CR=1 FL=1